MPLARYFLYVGGVLLVLLLIADVCLPGLPLSEEAAVSSPVIRIHSDQKWPERIVFDTSTPIVVPTRISEPAIPASATRVSDLSANVRSALAYLKPSAAKQPDMPDLKKHDPRKQRPRKISRPRALPQAFQIARHPQFGSFGFFTW